MKISCLLAAYTVDAFVLNRIQVTTNGNGPHHGPVFRKTCNGDQQSSRIDLLMSSSENQMDGLPPRKLVQLGMLYFKQGDVNGSIEIFDRAEKMEPSIRPYLWQRGISYYYADRFQEGSEQFRYDVKVNPLDVEEIVWDIACQYMANQNSGDIINKMSLPKGKTDRRKIMVRECLSNKSLCP